VEAATGVGCGSTGNTQHHKEQAMEKAEDKLLKGSNLLCVFCARQISTRFFVSYERNARQKLEATKRDGRNYKDHTSKKLLSMRPAPKRTLWPVAHT
jgi:hypothetical protein